MADPATTRPRTEPPGTTVTRGTRVQTRRYCPAKTLTLLHCQWHCIDGSTDELLAIHCHFTFSEPYRRHTQAQMSEPTITVGHRNPEIALCALPGARSRYPKETTMTAAPLDKRVGLLERRVAPLEAKVERLETWAGPGQNMSFSDGLAELRKKFDEFGKVQAKHTTMLTTLTGDVAGLKTDVATLKTDMVEVKADVAGLKTDMVEVKADVATLKTDVAGLKTDMVEVKATLGEILDRLPPRRET